jgi:hypothetical protein
MKLTPLNFLQSIDLKSCAYFLEMGVTIQIKIDESYAFHEHWINNVTNSNTVKLSITV